MKVPLYILTLCLVVGWCNAANILVVLPIPTFSHFNAYVAIFKELARKGNNVTVVSPYPLATPIPNYTDIVITNTLDEIFGSLGTRDIRDNEGVIADIVGVHLMCPAFLNPLSKLPELKAFINEDASHFDVVILETFFCQEPFLALGHKYNAPVISIHPVFMNLIIAEYTGNPLPMSHIPQLKVPATDNMSFIQQLQSAFYFISEYIAYHLYFKGVREEYMKENFKYPGSENIPPLDDLLFNTSLILLDSHVAISFPKPFLPNVVEFGGLSIQEAMPLPKNLETFINEAKDGVVFFTWGSHYNSTNMKPPVLSKFLSAFSKLKQRVLFKWENQTLTGKPDNVYTAPWFPQASVLGHPNVKVFITHCGIHGIAEAVYNGVPILGTPLFADQHQNIKIAEQAGYALGINIDSFSEQELLVALDKLIYEPSYKRAALRQSAIFKDRPLTALDNAVYWIEYVIRHSGARHLRPSSSNYHWNRLFYIFVPFLAINIICIILPLFVLKLMFLMGFAVKEKRNKNTKNKKE